MRLVSFSDAKGVRVGVHDAESNTVVDLSASTRLPKEMTAFVALGKKGLARARKAVKSGDHRLPVDGVKILAPFPRPARNILCVGKNYHDHAREFHNSGFDASAGADAIPEVPIMFTKWPNSVIGPGDAIPSANDYTNSVDYEGELTVVMGEGGRNISQKNAYKHVYGYTIINDVTARTLQNRHKQWFLGKSPDGFCPMGPCIVTADEIKDVTQLRLLTKVNGEVRQDAYVSQLIFDIPRLIEDLSKVMTLEPGDLIATGTCAGVGIGFTPPKYLKPGDRVAITIEPIGTLENPVA
ncbi:MAG: fumarylacetoacetate hydrolase family protein [Betaproteobacteria bacterium]|nr:fumarylacetoacetate hydrolase family protein [Betaproteobacteria bacterium]MDH4292803.1 fumarylacetoacetate hydrolase family protein [Betaproteobacteria bacterium]MDH5342113.1 fumarylacetoacetate hydrolase family protein [Betaproteobacteria bacterium]